MSYPRDLSEIRTNLQEIIYPGLKNDAREPIIQIIALCIELCDYAQGLQTQVDNLGEIIDRTEKTASRAANTASCLANGIQPD